MLLLACMVILVAGVPLPVLSEKSTLSSFPCQNSPCGCNTAAQCWNKCCCLSDPEKLAWAEKNGVVPPAFLVQRLGHRPACDSTAKVLKSRCCTASKEAPRPTQISPPAINKLPALNKLPAINEALALNEALVKRPNVRVVLFEAVNKCRGVELAIRLFSSALVSFQRPVFELPAACFLYAMVVADDAAESVPASIDPPIP